MDSGQDDGRERRVDQLAAMVRDAERGAKPRLGGSRAKQDDGARLHDRELDVEPRPARRDVLRPRLLVNPPLAAWLPVEVLDDIGHVDVTAIDACRLERAVEKLAGRPD